MFLLEQEVAVNVCIYKNIFKRIFERSHYLSLNCERTFYTCNTDFKLIWKFSPSQTLSVCDSLLSILSPVIWLYMELLN